VTHLRKMMLEELQRRNYSQHTTRYYIRTVFLLTALSNARRAPCPSLPFRQKRASDKALNVSHHSGPTARNIQQSLRCEIVLFVSQGDHRIDENPRFPRTARRRGLRTVLKKKLLSFYAHVGEFSKILIEGGHWRVFGRSGCRY
jgi:hypothetical protein